MVSVNIITGDKDDDKGQVRPSGLILDISQPLHPPSLLSFSALMKDRVIWEQDQFIARLKDEIKSMSDMRLENLPEGIKIAASLILACARQAASSPQVIDEPSRRLLNSCKYFNKAILQGLHRDAREVIDYVASMPLAGLDDMERHLIVTELYRLSWDAPEVVKTKCMTTAFNVASGAAYSPDAEKFEDAQLYRVKEALEKDSFITAEKQNWPLYAKNPDLYEDEIIALARRVATVYAEVSGVADVAEVIAPFRISKEDCSAEMLKRGRNKDSFALAVFFGTGMRSNSESLYRGLPVADKPTIGINLHRDAISRYEDDYYVFESLVIHEQAHRHEKALMDKLESNSKDPRSKMVDSFRAFDLLGNSWHNEHDYGWEFYRMTPRERHAFATQRKIYALRTGEPLPTEPQLVLRDYVTREQGHKRESLKYKFSEAATPDALRAEIPEDPDNSRRDKIRLSAFLALKSS